MRWHKLGTRRARWARTVSVIGDAGRCCDPARCFLTRAALEEFLGRLGGPGDHGQSSSRSLVKEIVLARGGLQESGTIARRKYRPDA